MKLVIFILILIYKSLCFNDTLINATIYDSNGNKIFKKYPRFNVNETLYTELMFKYIPNNPTSSNFIITTYWFFKEQVSYFNTLGFFFAFGHTEVRGNGMFNDFKICRFFKPIIKCEDYFWISNTYNLEKEIFENFDPILDTSRNGTDDIFSYELKDIVSEGIDNYNSAIVSKLILPMYQLDKYDLQIKSTNNFTFIAGSLNQVDSMNQFINFTVLKTGSWPVTFFISNSSRLLQLNNFILLILILLILKI